MSSLGIKGFIWWSTGQTVDNPFDHWRGKSSDVCCCKIFKLMVLLGGFKCYPLTSKWFPTDKSIWCLTEQNLEVVVLGIKGLAWLCLFVFSSKPLLFAKEKAYKGIKTNAGLKNPTTSCKKILMKPLYISHSQSREYHKSILKIKTSFCTWIRLHILYQFLWVN